MEDEKAYTLLSKNFRRFKIEVTEMIDITHYVTGIIHCGMGDFQTYKGEGKTLTEAVNNCLEKRKTK